MKLIILIISSKKINFRKIWLLWELMLEVWKFIGYQKSRAFANLIQRPAEFDPSRLSNLHLGNFGLLLLPAMGTFQFGATRFASHHVDHKSH